MGGVREGCTCPWCEWARNPPPIGSKLKIINSALHETGMENKVMTRDEAIKKLQEVSNNTMPRTPYEWIKALEALGLLKFDEPVKPKAVQIIAEVKSHLNCFPSGREPQLIRQLLDIIDNKYDDIKTVRIGDTVSIDYNANGGSGLLSCVEIRNIRKFRL